VKSSGLSSKTLFTSQCLKGSAVMWDSWQIGAFLGKRANAELITGIMFRHCQCLEILLHESLTTKNNYYFAKYCDLNCHAISTGA